MKRAKQPERNRIVAILLVWPYWKQTWSDIYKRKDKQGGNGGGIIELDLMKRELLDMRLALDRERCSRVVLEDHVMRNVELARLQSQMAGQSPVSSQLQPAAKRPTVLSTGM